MSGAAGLAAAKRRRSESASNSNTRIQSSDNSSSSASQRVRYTPIQLLQLHNVRIDALEKREKSPPIDIDAINNRLTELENNNAAPKQTEKSHSDVVIQDLNEKITNLESKISIMNETISKIQNYAMETSMSVMKIKNDMSSEEENIKMSVKEYVPVQKPSTHTDIVVEEAQPKQPVVVEETTEELPVVEETSE